MPLYRTIAVSALIWSAANVDAFVPRSMELHESRTRTAPDRYVVSSSARQRPLLHMSTRSPPEVNFYKVLGVDRQADVGEIKTAYRNLAKLYHPGKRNSASEENRSILAPNSLTQLTHPSVLFLL
jgi:hypothetical protein